MNDPNYKVRLRWNDNKNLELTLFVSTGEKNLTLGANMDSQKGGLTDEPHILIGERTQQTRNIFILTKALIKAPRILQAR